MQKAISLTVLTYIMALTFVLSIATNEAFAGKKDEIVVVKESQGAFLGIYPAEIDDDTREALDFKGDGVLINDVVDEGPAKAAGIEAGDILVKIEGVKIKQMKDIHTALSKHKPGDKIKVYVNRDGKEKDYKVKLAERPPMEMAQMAPMAPMAPMHKWKMKKVKGGFLGVHGQTIKDQLADYFGVKHGVLIEGIVKDSPAEKAGLKAGDVIVKLGDEKIESMDDLVDEVRDRKADEKVDVEYYRDKKAQKVSITLSEKEFTEHMFGGSKRIIFGDGDEDYHFEWDMEDLGESLEDIFENMELNIHEGAEDLREDMEELREEMERLREELKQMKSNK